MGYVLTNVVLIKTKLGGYNLTKLDFKTLEICIDAFNIIMDQESFYRSPQIAGEIHPEESIPPHIRKSR